MAQTLYCVEYILNKNAWFHGCDGLQLWGRHNEVQRILISPSREDFMDKINVCLRLMRQSL